TAAIQSASGGNYEALAVDATAVTTVVSDDVDTTTVSLTATPSAAEGGTITYTASVGAPVTGSPVSVVLDNGQTITIAVGSSTGSVSVAGADDVYAGTATNVTAAIQSASGGNYEALAVDATAVTTVVSDDVDTTTVSLTATPSAAEGGTITYTASVGAPVTGSPVSVVLDNGQTITIAVGSSTGSVSVAVADDVYAGTATNVTAAIQSASGG